MAKVGTEFCVRMMISIVVWCTKKKEREDNDDEVLLLTRSSMRSVVSIVERVRRE